MCIIFFDDDDDNNAITRHVGNLIKPVLNVNLLKTHTRKNC